MNELFEAFNQAGARYLRAGNATGLIAANMRKHTGIKKWIAKRLLQGLVVASVTATIAAESEEITKHSSRAESRARLYQKAILQEHKELGTHEWAGEYFEGDGLGVNVSLWIAPKTGYVFEWYGCLGLYDRNYGAVTNANGRLHLSFTFENNREGFRGIASEFIPVKWGRRSYLIPSEKIIDFCNAVNSRVEPREGSHGRYLLRRGDEKVAVVGKPAVPSEYQAYLLKSPIRAEIVKIGSYTTRPSVVDWKFKVTPVTVNVGKKSGLLPGMELSVTAPRSVVESVEITKVGDNESEGIVTQAGEENEGPKVGWKLSTLPWWMEKSGN